LDSFWYVIGYSRFAQGQGQQAGEMFRKVAAYKPIDKATGRETESTNKWPALFILGQIYHSLGQVPEAIEQYRMVEDRFPDAKKSIDYFLHKAIRLPEVTTIRPGKPVELPLSFRNLAECEVKVYRIDLMKFALLRQDLSGITQINLAGIQPQHEATVRLGNGQDYRDRTHTLTLPLKDEGAYLVVCRGDSLFASGLVLLSPLEMHVQHAASEREVRATVRDAVADRYIPDAHIKITGSGNTDFVSGKTDRRGLFIAQGIVGSPTVIAQAGSGKYAFHRGPAILSTAPLASSAGGLPVAQAVSEQTTGRSAGIVLSRVSEMTQRIQTALNAETSLSAQETPLEDVVRLLAQRHRIPIELDRKALENVGVGTDTPVTHSLKGIALRSALRVTLKQLGLVYTVRDEVLLITTPEEAEARLATVVYPVTDLVRNRDAKGEQWSDYDTLIDLITSTIAPTTWETVGGPGSIQGMPYQNVDVIVLSQTDEVHEQISLLLEKLRSVPGAKAADGKPPLRERPADSGAVPSEGGIPGLGGAPSAAGAVSSPAVRPPGQPTSGAAHLLQGLRDTHRRLQGGQAEKLDAMYKQGMGMGGMGGMAGGMF
jgi:hypothetical protein